MRKKGHYEDYCWRDLKCGKCGYNGHTTDRFCHDPRNNYMKERYYLNKTKYQNHSDEISLVGCESNNYTVGNKINENHIVEQIYDSGASCHMIGSKVGLQNYIEFEEKRMQWLKMVEKLL